MPATPAFRPAANPAEGRAVRPLTPGPSGRRYGRIVAAAGVAAILGLGLVGCGGASPEPEPTQTRAASSPGATPGATPTAEPAPTLAPGLSASENLDYFDYVARGVLRADKAAGGRAFIDALVAGGFDKNEMEVTFDRTQADLAADSIQFSVRINGECLIGQTGPAADGYHSMVADVLGSGTCLVGGTRQIDW